MNKADKDKVIAALETIFGEGLSWREIAEAHKEALTIMRGLEDAEPVGWKIVPIDSTHEMVAAYLKANTDYWELTDALPNHPWKWRNGTPQEATAVGYHAMLAAAPPAPNAATSPQAAQTALKSESLAQAAQAPARLPGEGKTIEALAPIQAAQTEAQNGCLSNCRNCQHFRRDTGGHCYMFKEEPQGVCAQFKASWAFW